MRRYAVFLRGMNLGGRRITNDDLCGAIEDLGFTGVGAFLASGNVVLAADADEDEVVRRLEEGLAAGLGYDVPTFVRSEAALRVIDASEPFPAEATSAAKGKPQIAFLREAASAAAREAVLALAKTEDLLAIEVGDRELHWLPKAGVSGTTLEWKDVERHLGLTTVRTANTVRRLLAKYF